MFGLQVFESSVLQRYIFDKEAFASAELCQTWWFLLPWECRSVSASSSNKSKLTCHAVPALASCDASSQSQSGVLHSMLHDLLINTRLTCSRKKVYMRWDILQIHEMTLSLFSNNMLLPQPHLSTQDLFLEIKKTIMLFVLNQLMRALMRRA